MTIRDYIERRKRLMVGVMAIWMVGIMTWAALDPHHGRGPGSRLLFFVTLCAVFAFSGLIYWFTRCPRCGSRFRNISFKLGLPRTLTYAADHCPRCQVNFSEPMQR